MVNPYFCYALSFLLALVLYPLGWSSLYPALSLSLAFFLIATIVIHIITGMKFATKTGRLFNAIRDRNSPTPGIWVTAILYLLWLAEFAYEGGVPLFKILFELPYNYRLFGIPTLHVFIVTFSSFYTIYLFHQYLSSRERIILILFIINLCAAVLIYSRAMLFFNASACLFIALTRIRHIPTVVSSSMAVAMLIVLYIFGAMGTLRVSRESKSPYDNQLFLDIGKATPAFRESFIPKEYFWTYIYVTSPLANLQQNINAHPGTMPTPGITVDMINNEILMDFVSKRVNAWRGTTREGESTIEGPFNVSTVYSRCFSYAGWYGLVFMAVFLLTVPLLYHCVVPRHSPFFLTGYATLCTMFLFLAYDNTIRFTGLSFQLVYPALLHLGCQWLPRMKKIFL